MTNPHILTGLSEIIDRYDGIILDLWGVVHNGIAPVPGVPECLAMLRDTGRRTCLLSNAPRRVPSVVARLKGMGIERDAYDEVFTSGEATFLALQTPPDPWHESLGRNLYHLGPDRDNDVYEGLNGHKMPVATPEEADFVLNTGVYDYGDTIDDYRPTLDRCLAAGLPMICANPDLIVHIGQQLSICAGMIAQEYEHMGGNVAYHGKPHRRVYDFCFDLLGVGDPSRILAVGDSLRTDVAGANGAGVDALFITGGIHQEELHGIDGDHPDAVALAKITRESGHHPRWAMPRLGW